MAFATKDGVSINDHFGWAEEFAVFDIQENDFSLVERRQVQKSDPDFEPEELDKINSRIEAIKDCSIMYCNNIGAVSAARVIRNKIHPIKKPEPVAIATEILRLQEVLKNPPVWIRKIQMDGNRK
ncbi:MAG: nitrogen fixation protein NifX [Spirochaetia bacterium]|nr:nitrogen fixation protein NifX [Spirochaetia bacterium]